MNRDNATAILALIAVVALLPLLSGAYVVTIGVFSGINALIAIGLCVLMGYAGQVSLGQAGFYGIGAYASAILTQEFGLPVAISIPAAMVFSAIAAVILAVPSLRLKGHYLAVATLSFGVIINIILNEWGPGGPSGFGDIPTFSLFGFVFDTTSSYFYLVWSCVVLVLLFSFNFINSRSGRALRALHGSELASKAMGLDVTVLKIKVFVISAVYASLAGSLYAHYVTFISPSSFTLFYSIIVLMMVVIGGITNLWGGVIGSIIITILPELLRSFEEFDVLVYGLILTLSLMFLRKGIVPLAIEKIRQLRGAMIARN
jgi:branched-chain amino acid transport system permease protein